MAGEWRTVSAEEFCSSVRDGTHDSPKPVDHGCFLVTSRHITGGQLDLANAYLISQADFDVINKRSKVDRWDVLLSMIGTVGEPCLIKEQPNFAIKNIGLFKSKGEAEGKWLYYYLRSPDAQQLIREQSRGTTQQYIPLGALREFPIPVPEDHAEMCAIANILGTLDDKIELNRRMNDTLEAMARVLFKSWFVAFDPVRAKAEGRDPGLPKPLADLFPDSFEDSELGEIPKGWEVRGLDEIARFLNGLALQKYPPKDGRSLPVVKIAQLRAGSTDGADAANADLDPDYIVEDGDVLFSWSGSLECVLWAGGRGALNQHLFKVTSATYPKWLYYLWIYQHLDDFRHIAAGKATTMGHIQRHHLSDAKVVLPPQLVLQVLDSTIAPMVDVRWQRQVESRTLAALRDKLLPRFICGELRVKDAEHFITEAPA